jgi:hypothetical protein
MNTVLWLAAVLAIALHLCPLTASQQDSSRAMLGTPMPQPPTLPVVTNNVLPGEGWVPGRWNVRNTAPVYDTWRAGRKRIAVVPRGSVISALGGLNVVHKPDVITVTEPIPALELVPGDTMLRYVYRGEGWADFWAKGRWYSNLDGGFITEADGSGCRSRCKARVTAPGEKTWWFHVRLADGRTGWSDAFHAFNPVLGTSSRPSPPGPPSSARRCREASFAGRVNGNEAYSRDLGDGLVFRLFLLEQNWGWNISVSPADSDDDYAYPVNPPLRFGNSQYLGTGYGETAKQQLAYEHNVFFVLNQRDFERIGKLAEDVLWPYQSVEPDKAAERYLSALRHLTTGLLRVKPTAYETSNEGNSVRWMQFSVTVIVPAEFRLGAGLNERLTACPSIQR